MLCHVTHGLCCYGAQIVYIGALGAAHMAAPTLDRERATTGEAVAAALLHLPAHLFGDGFWRVVCEDRTVGVAGAHLAALTLQGWEEACLNQGRLQQAQAWRDITRHPAQQQQQQHPQRAVPAVGVARLKWTSRRHLPHQQTLWLPGCLGAWRWCASNPHPPEVGVLVNGAGNKAAYVPPVPKDVWEHTGEGGRRLHCGEADLPDVVGLAEPKDASDLVHAHAALDVDDGAVEGPANILKVGEDEGLVDVKTTRDDVLAVLQPGSQRGSHAGRGAQTQQLKACWTWSSNRLGAVVSWVGALTAAATPHSQLLHKLHRYPVVAGCVDRQGNSKSGLCDQQWPPAPCTQHTP